MHSAHVATRSRNGQVHRKVLDQLQACLTLPVVNLQECTELICTDAALLARVLQLARNSGVPRNARLGDSLVLCGVARLRNLCRLLKFRSKLENDRSGRPIDLMDRRGRLVC